MHWQGVYHAACRELQRVEGEFGKGDEYRAAILRLNELEDLRCGGCQGFGFNNPVGGHTSNPQNVFSVTCKPCNGTGFELDIGKIAERELERTK